MKKLFLLEALTIGLSASAQDYKGHYGIGLAVGEPSGFSIKKFNNSSEAFQYTVGYSTGQNSGINLGVDFLLHNYDYISAERGCQTRLATHLAASSKGVTKPLNDRKQERL